jgi:hypothetical protein
VNSGGGSGGKSGTGMATLQSINAGETASMTWCHSVAGCSVGTLWFVVAYIMPGSWGGGVTVDPQ